MQSQRKTIIVTGGAGFIGSTVISELMKHSHHKIINIDKLTYAGNLDSLKSFNASDRYVFCQADICLQNKIENIFEKYQPDIIMHLAAESHVDRSVNTPNDFIQTNVIGTYTLLEVARKYWISLKNKNLKKYNDFRFHHVSTDEVYGDLQQSDEKFTELSSYAPSSPYSASKASSDHLVRAWYRTFGLPVVITNCSNNYGPHQFPEKLIPLTIINAILGKKIPVYGTGNQVRDWLYVEEHARALVLVACHGAVGETYNIGGNEERENIEVIQAICSLLHELRPQDSDNARYESLITFVADRPGHDERYAVNASKIKSHLGWEPQEKFETGIRKTVEWYLENEMWWGRVLDGSYREAI